MTSDDSRRALFGALSVSLLLHLIAVFGWYWPQIDAVAVPQPLMHVVVSANSGALAAQKSQLKKEANNQRPALTEKLESEPVQEKPPERTRNSAATKKTEPVVALETPVSPKPSPDPMPQTESRMPAAVSSVPEPFITQAAKQTGRATGEVAGITPLVAGSTARPSMAAGSKPAEGVSADSLRQYRIALASAALRARHYPALARSRAWEGVVEVSVVISSATPVPKLELAKSSGHEVLDEQAMAMLSRAIAQTDLPDDLRGKNLRVPMPIRFSLDD